MNHRMDIILLLLGGAGWHNNGFEKIVLCGEPLDLVGREADETYRPPC